MKHSEAALFLILVRGSMASTPSILECTHLLAFEKVDQKLLSQSECLKCHLEHLDMAAAGELLRRGVERQKVTMNC